MFLVWYMEVYDMKAKRLVKSIAYRTDSLLRHEVSNIAPSHICNALHVFHCNALQSTQ